MSARAGDDGTASLGTDDDAPADDAGAAPAFATRDLPADAAARYELGGEHGRGGLGRVLRARDLRLERDVAVKELVRDADDRAAARFVREALITARLQHPGIVPVYDAGRRADGHPFYAMKLVDGRTLRDAIADAQELDARLALVPHLLAVAEAIAYAHSEDVIHRDLKPSNVLVGSFGETVVVDWGVAKDRRAAADELDEPGLYELAHSDLTRAGSVVGTPAYMPPEQARGDEVDERADVYALGAILYHILAARPPFEGHHDTVLQRVAAGPPPALAELVPGAPRDLLAIADKAMARAPADRYPDAKAVARDLSRFLTGQLVGARRYGRLALVARWVRRHRAAVTVAAALATALAITGAVSLGRILYERGRFERERDVARARSAELVLAQARAWVERDPARALAWLAVYPDDGAAWDDARALAAEAHGRGAARHVLADHPELVGAVALHPRGALFATASDREVRAYDDRGALAWRSDMPATAMHLAWSPDGSRLAIGDDRGHVRVVSERGEPIATTALGSGEITALRYAPDGAAIAAGTSRGRIALLDPAGREAAIVRDAGSPVAALRFAGGRTELVSADREGRVLRWPIAADARGRAPTELVRVAPDTAGALDASADGATVVVADGRRVVVWREGAGAVAATEHDAPVRAVAIARGWVVSAGDDRVVRRFELGPGAADILFATSQPATTLAASADGRVLAVGDAGGDVVVWRDGVPTIDRGHASGVVALAVSADGATVLSGARDREARVWPTQHQGRLVRVAGAGHYRVAFLPGDDHVAMTGADGAVRRVAVADGAVEELARHGDDAYELELLPDGGVVTAGWDGAILVARGGDPLRFETGSRVWGLAVAPDGAAFASASDDGVVRAWPVAGGAPRELARHAGGAHDVAFSPDGRVVASSGADHVIRLSPVDPALGPPARELRGHTDTISVLLYDDDGGTLYSASWDGTVRAWDVASGQATVLGTHDGRVRTLARAPDGGLLASGSADRTIRLWSLDGSVRVLHGHTNEVRHVAFSPDGALIASAGWDDTVRVWRVDGTQSALLRGHTGLVQRVAFSRDGATLASVSMDGTLGLWDVGAMPAIPSEPKALRSWLTGATTATAQ